MSDTLVFIEYPEQLDAAMNAAAKRSSPRFIALSPHAEYALEKRGIAFARPDDHSSAEAIERLGFANFQRADAVCALADSYLRRFVPELAALDVRPATFFGVWIKRMMDAVTLRLHEMSAMLNAGDPAEVLYFDPGPPTFDDVNPFLSGESIYSRVLGLLSEGRQLPVHVLPFDYRRVRSIREHDSASTRGSDVLNRFRARFAGTRLARAIRVGRSAARKADNLDRGRPSATAAQDDKMPLLFQAASSNLSPIMERLERDATVWLWGGRSAFDVHGASPHRLGQEPCVRGADEVPPLREEPFADCWRGLVANSDFRAHFHDGTSDWFELVSSRLRQELRSACWDSLRVHTVATEWLRRVRPCALVAHSLAYHRPRALAHAARSNGVPVIVMPHGPFGQAHVPVTHVEDVPVADYLLAYGDGMADYVRRRCPEGARPVSVGAPMLDRCVSIDHVEARRLRRRCRLDPRKKLGIYLMNALDGNWRYLSYRQCSDSRAFRIQRRIVDALASRPDAQFLIKGHPNPAMPSSPIGAYVRDKRFGNCLHLSGVSFRKLVPLADFFVFDYVATSVLEAISTDRPIYVFNDFLRFEAAALEALRRRVVFDDDLDRFCRRLGRDLASGEAFTRTPPDLSYLWLFGTHRNDGRSADRAAAAVVEIARGNVPGETAEPPPREPVGAPDSRDQRP